MEKFIGLDVHSSSSTFGVVGPTGRRIKNQVTATNGQELVSFLKSMKGSLHLAMEEGTQSSWLVEILSPYVDELVVIGLGLEKSRGPKDDKRDAFGLANKIRLRSYSQSVYKQLGPYSVLRHLAKVYNQMMSDVVRVQNRIKALYRSRGVQVTGKSVYSEKNRNCFLEQLPRSTREGITHLYAQYDALLPVKKNAEKEMIAESHRHTISQILETCPGLGEKRIAQLLAIVITPHRFRQRQQFWSYCGLGIVMRSSSDWEQDQHGNWDIVSKQRTRGLNRSHNRMLKAIFKGAATTIIGQPSYRHHPLMLNYRRMLDAGTKPNLAKLTLARKLAATVLAMWKKKEIYDTEK
jgi:transposase